VDKESHILFEKYQSVNEANGIVPYNKKEVEKRNKLQKREDKDDDYNTYSRSFSSDDTPENVPPDPSVNYTYAGPESGEKFAGRGTGENPERKKLPQGQQSLKPQPAPQPKPNTQSQSAPALAPQPKPNIQSQSAPAPAPNVNQPSTFKNFIKGGKKGLKGLGKALTMGAKAVDPFSKQGLLGKAATAAKNIENWAKTGSGFVDNIYGKKQGSADDAVKKGNEHEFFTNIRNTFKNNNKTKAAYADAVANSVIPPGQQLSLIHPKNPNKPKQYTNIEHYANVVLDQFKYYLVNKNYSENDSGKYTVQAFTTRTNTDNNKNKIMLKILKKHGLLYDAVAKFVP
jgi:hypothetical protein